GQRLARSRGGSFFYLHDTLPLKLGTKLPFTHFERLILRALNVAPTQLHSNSWAFVRAFELLCEDMRRAPSLRVFFWFFALYKTTKIGWKSLSNRPKRKLLKPFLESFKVFKNRYFKVGRGAIGPNLLANYLGEPFFPLYWTPQPVVFVSIARKDLEKWEDELIEELNDMPFLSSADLIKGAGYSTGYLKKIKMKTSQPTDVGTSTLDVPLAATKLGEAPQTVAEEVPQVQPMVILDSPEGSFPVEEDQTLSGKRAANTDDDY
ncbi:hypothetical protein CR513_62148, partial [Mucuna pruriens]